MEKKKPRQLIVDTLLEKSTVKLDVCKITASVFKGFKKAAAEIASDLQEKVSTLDRRLEIKFKEKGEGEFVFQIAGDVIVFTAHTNVFDFDKSHQLWSTSYLKENPSRSLCGVIHIYNFLADSYEYQRMDDVGYLIARVFINKEKHYFVEGKRQLSFLYNDFSNAIVKPEDITAIIESAILYSMDFDLLVPPYDSIKQVSVSEMYEWSKNLGIKTGKRLGFKFQADGEDVL